MSNSDLFPLVARCHDIYCDLFLYKLLEDYLFALKWFGSVPFHYGAQIIRVGYGESCAVHLPNVPRYNFSRLNNGRKVRHAPPACHVILAETDEQRLS